MSGQHALTETLTALRRHLRMAHHIPGRIRIKLDTAILADAQAQALARLLQGLPLPALSILRGVSSCRVNRKSLSVVVEYDTGTIEPHLLNSLFSAADATTFRRDLENLMKTLDIASHFSQGVAL